MAPLLDKSHYPLLLAAVPVFFGLQRLFRRPVRPSKVPHLSERVLVLGGTSGIGRAIALQYAERGARVCVVGRRQVKLVEVMSECGDKCLAVGGDFSNVEDMVRVRDAVEKAWGGLDTMIIAAGVSAIQPLLDLAGIEAETKGSAQATAAGIQHTVNIAAAATQGNYVGPLIAAVTFIPLLSRTSSSPSILLLSSLASVIPAPTRTLYGSTKSASLLLYQSLSIEHPTIHFSFVLPSTVEGDFRAGAVDSRKVHETGPTKGVLKTRAVARECIRAVDWGVKSVFMPGYNRLGIFLYWIWPSFIERKAKAKYDF